MRAPAAERPLPGAAGLVIPGRAGEQPQSETVGIEAEQLGHAAEQPVGLGGQPDIAVEHVLEGVVGGVAYVGLGVDDQPRLPFGGQHVAGMKIGAQQHFPVGGGRQLTEQCHPFTRQTRIQTAAATGVLVLELLGPQLTHRLERAKPVSRGWLPPQAAHRPAITASCSTSGRH
jgi:hypothetical protein